MGLGKFFVSPFLYRPVVVFPLYTFGVVLLSSFCLTNCFLLPTKKEHKLIYKRILKEFDFSMFISL